MKKLLFLIIISTSFSAYAQRETFDIVDFITPKGWQRSEKATTLAFSKEGDKGEFCSITIYKSIDATDNAQANFDMSWEALIQKALGNGKAVMQPGSTDNGWETKIGSSPFEKEGIKGAVILISSSKDKKLVNIVSTTNTNAFQKEIETFLGGIVLKGQPSTAQKSASNNAGQTKNLTSGPKYDLWMAHKLKVGGSLAEYSFQYVVLSSDNRCLFYFPEKGLNNVEQDFPSSSDSWGKVSDKGDKLVLVNKFGNMELYKRTATAMGRYANSNPGDYYKKCKPVNGLRIEGAYSSDVSLYKNKSNLLDKITYDPNKRPIIFFKKDGTYINEGLAFSNITKGDDFAIGKGTYELKDFSIILTTQSGRKLQVSFAGLLDANPATSSDGYIVNQNLFYKLDNSYQSH
ncbi:hypothetical protein HDC90_000476 [Pedobacter sp. AK013]|uniref:hypothetical protein n=1 Tax=Pedobacter sp. AK013 TaxID=2723071 RepID=UPI001618281D|nr:hypothetical protein [Pedobacter sp. AK013]MBB6235876.1 hypothetical protein [Pedobacter sp. AK013]